jgi:hypothetical protein
MGRGHIIFGCFPLAEFSVVVQIITYLLTSLFGAGGKAS